MSSCIVLCSRRLEPLLEAEFATGFWDREASVFQTMECKLAVRMTPAGGKQVDFVSAAQISLPWGPPSETDCLAIAVREVMAQVTSYRETRATVLMAHVSEIAEWSEPDVKAFVAAVKPKRVRKAKPEPAAETW